MFKNFLTTTRTNQPTKTYQRTTTNTITTTHNKQTKITYEPNKKTVDKREFTTEKRSQSITEKF